LESSAFLTEEHQECHGKPAKLQINITGCQELRLCMSLVTVMVKGSLYAMAQMYFATVGLQQTRSGLRLEKWWEPVEGHKQRQENSSITER
jgi:hypothetical protein